MYNDCCRDRLLRDAFVSGLHSSTIMTKLLQECENKKFNDCVEKAKILEQYTNDAIDIKQEIKQHSSFKLNTKSYNKKKGNKVPFNYVCIRCTDKGKHFQNDCFAIDMECDKCGRIGHIKKACLSKPGSKTNALNEEEEEQGTSDERGIKERHECSCTGSCHKERANHCTLKHDTPTSSKSRVHAQSVYHHNNCEDECSLCDSFLG